MKETETVTKAARYEYPANGAYNETIAILEDGRKLIVNTQYKAVRSFHHADGCDAMMSVCGVCNCVPANIDVEALVDDAKKRGRRGYAPMKKEAVAEQREVDNRVCEKCGTYCDGDCAL